MSAITLDIKGMSEAMAKFDKYKKIVQSEIKDEVAASALKIQSDAKKLAPVNLGMLRNSIYLKSNISSPNSFMFTIGASKKYAPYVEFGTGGKVSIPKGYENYAATFKTKSGGKFKDMVLALTEWVQKKGIASGKQSKSAAYMIALSILRKGLRPQPFLIPAFEQEKPKLKARILNIIKNAKS
jgi:HK97 gp10 family phage protein